MHIIQTIKSVRLSHGLQRVEICNKSADKYMWVKVTDKMVLDVYFGIDVS